MSSVRVGSGIPSAKRISVPATFASRVAFCSASPKRSQPDATSEPTMIAYRSETIVKLSVAAARLRAMKSSETKWWNSSSPARDSPTLATTKSVAMMTSGTWSSSTPVPPSPGRRSLERLDRRDEVGQALLRVGEEHPGLRVRVQLVVDARVAAAHRALDDHDRPGLVDVEDRHPGHGGARPARRRVGHVVGPDDERNVRSFELGVDVLHLPEL